MKEFALSITLETTGALFTCVLDRVGVERLHETLGERLAAWPDSIDDAPAGRGEKPGRAADQTGPTSGPAPEVAAKQVAHPEFYSRGPITSRSVISDQTGKLWVIDPHGGTVFPLVVTTTEGLPPAR